MEEKILNQFIKLNEVVKLTGLSKASVYRLAKDSNFPKPIKLTPYGRSSAWILDEINQWMEECIDASRNQKEMH